MLFISYFELDESVSQADRLAAAQRVMNAELFPPEGFNIIRWDTTVDGWGVLIVEAEDATTLARGIEPWRVATGGFFKTVKTSPAIPTDEYIPLIAELALSLSVHSDED